MLTEKAKLNKALDIFWPLAISWLFMSLDTPIISAVIGRMNNPEICLAAHGGIVVPIALVIEAPIIAMLSASIALCKDWLNYRKMYRFMMTTCAGLTVIHVLISLTPLFSLVVRDLMGTPAELLPYARIGLIIVIPWTWSIGFRRFYQGILIRCGYSKQVTIGSMVRVLSLMIVLVLGYVFKDYVSGALVGAAALSAGVIAEAIYAGVKGIPVAKHFLDHDSKVSIISNTELASFYIPLVITQIINFGWVFIGSAAMNRMITPIASLAVWPIMSGLLNILRSFGNACNEVTMTILLQPGYYRSVRKFTFLVAFGSLLVYALLILTPLKDFWFQTFSALNDELSVLARNALLLIFLIPFTNAFLNFYQAILMLNKKTKGILEGLLAFFGMILAFIGVGIVSQKWPGVYVITAGMNFAILVQTIWLRIKSKRFISQYQSEIV
ncbi:hypothetical protein [Flexilinea flocculi]|jgi:hypothetical protein|uniref:Na+-driven multidrug efflux pump n=1 Tax=Flexilinea flocculi TaxID=1678840 RepID=A0A0S7BST4_9CHLR|nr:hypothetical protein [Flexilinea flocculi]GAP41575.1 hypothetical protein ATC1_131567 [Flexilinea flocculi]